MSPIAIISIILLLAFAGFLAASESALTSISRIVVEELEGKRGGLLLRKYSAQPARYLNVILLVLHGRSQLYAINHVWPEYKSHAQLNAQQLTPELRQRLG